MVCKDVPEDFRLRASHFNDLYGRPPDDPVGVLTVLVAQLEAKQQTSARCREYALAITKLEEAQHWLQAVKG